MSQENLVVKKSVEKTNIVSPLQSASSVGQVQENKPSSSSTQSSTSGSAPRSPARKKDRYAPRRTRLGFLPPKSREREERFTQSSFDQTTLRVIPIGGMEEVGRNMSVLEYGNDIIIIDMGLQFTEEDMPGIDYIIPNVEYLRGKEKNIRGVIITHGHFDHIGAIPHIMPRIGNPPLYATNLTLALIKKRQEEHEDRVAPLDLNEITKDTKLEFGVFKVEFFGVSHNIPASLGVIVRTPEGIVIHTGDFKLDDKSDIAGTTELDKLEAISKEKPLLLMSDSTNAREPGKQHSEMDIMTELEEIIKNAKGRLIFGTFASVIGRINEILQVGAKLGRKIIIEGRSMKNNVDIAKELGFITVPKGVIVGVEEMKHIPNEKILILATGAQGESNAALMRIANSEHRFIEVEPGDTFVFSSSVVPGNERTVQRLTDRLYRKGVDVINYKMMDIHAGGHCKQDDLQRVIEIVKPQFFMPIEGNHSFLCLHAKIAKKAGLDDKQIIVADNGNVVECKNGVCKLTKEKANSDYVFVDGLGVGDVSNIVLRDRQMMSADGMFVVIAIFDNHTRKLRGNPDLISRGFIYMRESKDLLMEVRRLVKKVVEHSIGNDPHAEINWVYIKDNIRDEVGEFLYHKTHRHPMVLPVVLEI